MNTAERGTPIGLLSIPRAVLSIATGVVDTVERAMVGEARIRTARGNAWAAVCADRERANQRAEIQRLVAALNATGRTTAPGYDDVPADRAPAGEPVEPAAVLVR
ncbi:hypothetical protein [Polymorphospora rubra]|uniref:Uncharacterized protein n=1 Tax=Polymorphospora rubra TaxID=338584 RepID=A0A810MUH2_9ACTN|nr:hypothetical protein [Polymorphospora rubra]BCJ63313.1 hypothetical protein Prubr_03340 [Polymorphospora rubra]